MRFSMETLILFVLAGWPAVMGAPFRATPTPTLSGDTVVPVANVLPRYSNTTNTNTHVVSTHGNCSRPLNGTLDHHDIVFNHTIKENPTLGGAYGPGPSNTSEGGKDDTKKILWICFGVFVFCCCVVGIVIGIMGDKLKCCR
ncbi:hypothetical protein QBC34DRAFT_410480 [Podospora aff. communis PSN243]|uniref:Uncharacterized protein n=1 Tax=Podospora aff. communis PSN243 TaxID=3040156 RepID=A0AAV9GG49_9PEZI|nr:hypothetical protein QBC34DRAFT_410480 [Podospora aff. communis PSN243]